MAVSRKTFLRVLGGGIVVAAGAVVAVPRLDAMPAVAVEGWRGPAPTETDPRRRALAWALLAPNPHNLQSWVVDLSQPGTIVLFVDRTRLLPQTDPLSRQILIGHGCFLEILAMAAARVPGGCPPQRLTSNADPGRPPAADLVLAGTREGREPPVRESGSLRAQ